MPSDLWFLHTHTFADMDVNTFTFPSTGVCPSLSSLRVLTLKTQIRSLCLCDDFNRQFPKITHQKWLKVCQKETKQIHLRSPVIKVMYSSSVWMKTKLVQSFGGENCSSTKNCSVGSKQKEEANKMAPVLPAVPPKSWFQEETFAFLLVLAALLLCRSLGISERLEEHREAQPCRWKQWGL